MNKIVTVILSLYFVAAVNCYYLNDNEGNFTRVKRQSQCGPEQHQCGSGECIMEDLLCDGTENCKDGSDETNACASIPCQPYLFRCSYGACINADFECNGRRDCRDNSDELSSKCANVTVTTLPTTTNSICGSDQFQCKSGQCIDDIDQCDGVENCTDGSDEVTEICSKIPCQPFTFRCAYGGCINENLRCNGKRNCRDNSDEEGCTDTVPTPTPTPATFTPTPVTFKPPIHTPSPPSKGGCILPPYPSNGMWTIFGPKDAIYLPGQYVVSRTILIYKCNRQYRLHPDNVKLSLCSNGQWDNQPKCLKTCSSIESTANMYVTCDLNGSNTSCTDPYDGTRAVIRCATLYEDEAIKKSPYRYCSDGTWDLPVINNCQPVCGLKSVEATQLVIGGRDTKKGEYPWQVGIYLLEDGTPKSYEFVCGGSILTPKITLTAAHCFERYTTPEVYMLTTGKYYSKFDDERDKDPQKSTINTLYIHEDYNNGEPYYAFDIAIVVLTTPFKMNKFVLPVCFDRDIDFDDNHLEGKKGIVTGWGYTKENSNAAENLKELEIEFHTKKTCTLPMEFKQFYTPYVHDKICAGLFNQGKGACQGDSGGPLVFLGERDRYYIRGIVSIAPKRRQGGCDSNQFSLFTSVRFHQEYILRTISRHLN